MIEYDPTKMLKKIAPEAKIKKLLTKDLSVKRAALSFVDDIDFIDKKSVTKVALKAAKSYQARIDDAPDDVKADLEKSLKANPALLIQRIQNEVVTQISEEIKDKYAGEQYEWLPSSSEEPDPEHQLNYGKIFTIGVGEMPNERYGCKCGMNILVKGSKLEL